MDVWRGLVERGRGEEDEFCPRGVDFCDERLDSFLESDEAFVGEGVVDSVVHAIAGEDEIGFCFCENAIDSCVEIGSWKRM